MKTTFQRRSVLLASLLLLSLLVLATGIQAAQAATVAGTGAGSGTTATSTTTQDGWLTAANTAARDRDVAAAAATSTTTQDGWLTAANTAARDRDVAAAAATRQASGAQPASSDTSSTTAWIAVGSVAAVLLIGFATWALMRRRQPGELPSAAYCAQHREDPLCSAV